MLAVSRFVLRHKLAVVIFWLVVLAAGGAASAKLPGRLSAQFALPGAAEYQASQQILRIYGNGGPGYPEIAVVTLPPGQPAGSPAGRQALGRAFAAAARIPGLRVAGYASTGDRAFLTRDPRLSYGLVFTPYTGELNPPSFGPQLTAAMRPELPPGSTVAVTGMNELASGGQARQGFGVLAETLLAGAAALAVLAFVFGSALALVPLLMAAVRSWRPAAAWSSPRISTRPISRWPASTARTRCGVSLTSGGISCGPGPLTPRRSATGATRGWSGSPCCTGRTTRWPPPHPAPTPARTPRAAGSGPSLTSTRTASCRPATPQRACCTRPPPRSSPR
jgi:hypothetical protein